MRNLQKNPSLFILSVGPKRCFPLFLLPASIVVFILLSRKSLSSQLEEVVNNVRLKSRLWKALEGPTGSQLPLIGFLGPGKGF